MEFEFLQSRRRARSRWSWPRFWLAFSCGGLLIIATVALLKAIESFHAVPEPVIGNHPETYVPPESDQSPPNLMTESPGERVVPNPVHTFLQEEQSLNSGRLDVLRQRQVAVEATDFTAQCKPQWDFRSHKREVIWFYHYRSGLTAEGHPLTVFGAVDGLGFPIFQHPPMAGDPLALLDSQYNGLKWIALENPRLALIGAVNGPWAESGAIIDLFLVTDNPNNAARFWRFQDTSSAEGPECSAQLIAFRDATADGYLDLCAFHLVGSGDACAPLVRVHAYDPIKGTFATQAELGSTIISSQMHQDFLAVESGHPLEVPHLIGQPATAPIFRRPPDIPVESEEDSSAS